MYSFCQDRSSLVLWNESSLVVGAHESASSGLVHLQEIQFVCSETALQSEPRWGVLGDLPQWDISDEN